MRIAVRGAMVITCFFFSLFAYAIGLQRGSIDLALTSSLEAFQPRQADHIRGLLQSAASMQPEREHLDLVEQLAKRSPMDPLVFELALGRTMAQGPSKTAQLLFESIMDRQPRSATARLYAFSHSLGQSDWDAGLSAYQRLIDLNLIDDRTLNVALIGVFREANDWTPLLTFIEREPKSGEKLLTALLREDVEPSNLLPLIQKYPRVQAAYLRKLIQADRLEDAFSAWRAFTGRTSELSYTAPFNGAFEQLSDPPPFNWKLNKDRAEIQSQSGLHVTFLGTGSPLVASQIMRAKPGSYSFSVIAKGRMPESGGGLQWSVDCARSGAPLAVLEVALTRIGETEDFVAPVSIPERNCTFQSITLRGKAGEFPMTSRTEIVSVQLIGANE